MTARGCGVQLLLADRLIEARDKSLNGRVFNVVQDERDTKLARDQVDLLPLARRSAMSMLEQVTSRTRLGSNGLARTSVVTPRRGGGGGGSGGAAPGPRPRPALQRHSATAVALHPVPERTNLQRHSAMSSFNHGPATAAAAAAAAADVPASSIAAVAPRTNTESPFQERDPVVPAIRSSAIRVDPASESDHNEDPAAATPSVAAVPWPGDPQSPASQHPFSPTSPPRSVHSAFAALPPISPHEDALTGMHQVSSVPQSYVDPGDARLKFYGRDEDDGGGEHGPGAFRIESLARGGASMHPGRLTGSGRRLSLDSAPQRSQELGESLFGRARRRGAELAERIRHRARSQDP